MYYSEINVKSDSWSLTCFFTSVILIFGARSESLNSTCFDFSRLSFLHKNTQQEAE